MARFIATGSTDPVYYVVTTDPHTHGDVFRFMGGGRAMQDIVNLMDDLGTGIDENRDAVFLLTDIMQMPAILRCYPGAFGTSFSPPEVQPPVLALAVSVSSLRAGHHCSSRPEGPGLLARYFAGPDWDCPVVQQRIEDWWLRVTLGVERFGSVEWSGSLRLPVSGVYRFQLTGGTGVAEARIGEHTQLSAGDIEAATLSSGVYPIDIRCRYSRPGDYCWLRWAPPGGDFGAIPSQFLEPRAVVADATGSDAAHGTPNPSASAPGDGKHG